MQSIFGLQLSQPLVYIAAFAVILLLLAVFAWVLRRIVTTSRGMEAGARGRQPRLGIVDTFAIDRQRQLVIVRRDSVEHLLLLGGTSDILIESNIIRAQTNASPPTPLRDQGLTSKPMVAANSPVNVKPNTMAELSFAPEPRESAVTMPAVSMPAVTMPAVSMPASPIPASLIPAISMPPVQKITPVPIPSDLTEIAQRFQNTSPGPITAEREPSIASPISTPPLRFPQPISTPLDEADRMQKTPENEPAPIIPASERAELSPAVKPEVRDIGSLNDTLRQLLGRTRDQ